MPIFTMCHAKTEILDRFLCASPHYVMGHQILEVVLRVSDQREARRLKAVLAPYLKEDIAKRATHVKAQEIDIQAFCITLKNVTDRALRTTVWLPYDTDENMDAIAGAFAADHTQLSYVPHRQRLSQKLGVRAFAK